MAPIIRATRTRNAQRARRSEFTMHAFSSVDVTRDDDAHATIVSVVTPDNNTHTLYIRDDMTLDDQIVMIRYTCDESCSDAHDADVTYDTILQRICDVRGDDVIA